MIFNVSRAVMQAKDLFPYEKNKDRFLKNSNRSRRGFKEALVEILENPKVKWGMRGQDVDEQDSEDEEGEGDEDSGDEKKLEDEDSDEEDTKPSKQVKNDIWDLADMGGVQV